MKFSDRDQLHWMIGSSSKKQKGNGVKQAKMGYWAKQEKLDALKKQPRYDKWIGNQTRKMS